jgi:hypothetical protein
MAVVRPLILTGSNDLIEMTNSQIDAVKNRCRYLYGANPSVTLSYVSSGGNISPSMRDNRKTAGAYSTSITSTPPENVTAEPGSAYEDYDHITQNVAGTSVTADTNNIAFPIYYTGSNIQSMSLTDFRDTFIYPAIDTLTSASNQPGMFRIHNATSLSGGYSRIGTTSQYVFKDTRANTSAYTASGIPEALDQPTDINLYYIFKKNNISAPSMASMLFVRNTDNNLQQYSQTAIDALLQNEIRHCAASVAGTRIRYNINGTGTTMGTSMVDTRLDGSGNYQTRFVNADDYRAQEFPNGSAVTVSTWTLRVNQT